MFTPTIELASADARGEIFIITLPGDKELLLLHSKKGSLRGGHSHSVDEVVVMLTGKMRYYKKGADGRERITQLSAGDGSFNPRGLIHMGEALTDLWLIEHKINARKGEWRNTDDDAYRAKVRANAAG